MSKNNFMRVMIFNAIAFGVLVVITSALTFNIVKTRRLMQKYTIFMDKGEVKIDYNRIVKEWFKTAMEKEKQRRDTYDNRYSFDTGSSYVSKTEMNEVTIFKLYDRYEDDNITLIIKKHKNGNVDIIGME